MKRRLLYIITLLICCSQKTNDSNLLQRLIVNKSGDVVLLRGLNIAHTAKRTVIPWQEEEDIKKMSEEWGLNFIRLTLFWSAIEPERGKYDKEYIEKIREIIKWSEKYSVYVLLDMHQDLFGYKATDSDEGDGAPQWAMSSTCPSFRDLTPWIANYGDNAVNCQFDAFWNNERGILDAYEEMWLFTIKMLGDENSVIGFDIMNEPWPGSLWITEEKRTYWEQNILNPFYSRIANKIRKISAKYIFYESHPLSDVGIAVNLDKPNAPNLIYAPHIYPISAAEGFLIQYYKTPQVAGNGYDRDIDYVFRVHNSVAIEHNVPMVVGEYGITANTPNAEKIIRKHIDIFDENFVGSAMWSYDKASKYGGGVIDDYGNPLTNLKAIIRPYPETIRGTPKSLRYYDNKFELEVESQREIKVTIKCPELKPCIIDNKKIIKGAYNITTREGLNKITINY